LRCDPLDGRISCLGRRGTRGIDGRIRMPHTGAAGLHPNRGL
jgi:hypothetical protein